MITINAIVNAPIEKVWDYWTTPAHIMQWNNASDDWHTPAAENDLRVEGKFSSTMAAKDGSFSFDFGGTYTAVEKHKLIEYVLDDGRKVEIQFSSNGVETSITESFDPETQNPHEMQQAGWQAILNNFKKYTENN